MSSCQSTYEIGLKSQVEVANAKKVAVCQSGRLDYVTVAGSESMSSLLDRSERRVMLPKNYTASALVSALPAGIEGKVIEGLKKPSIPANQVVAPFRAADYASVYDPIPPMPGVDLVIHVRPRTVSFSTAGGMGYYNSAAGVYIPAGGSGPPVEDPRVGGYGGVTTASPEPSPWPACWTSTCIAGAMGNALGASTLPSPEWPRWPTSRPWCKTISLPPLKESRSASSGGEKCGGRDYYCIGVPILSV